MSTTLTAPDACGPTIRYAIDGLINPMGNRRSPSICPLCKGDGELAPKPLPNSVEVPTSAMLCPILCRACNGKGIVWPP